MIRSDILPHRKNEQEEIHKMQEEIYMKKMMAFLGMLFVMAAASVAGAAEITTSDGVLSIDTPADEWKETADPNYWFVVSDGKNTITVDHLSNGEILPSVDIAGSEYGAVYQAFVSTRNEVFVVKGLAASQEELNVVMQAIGTIRVLKFDTKTAVQKDTEVQVSQFGLRQINATYYVTADELNVRSGCSTDDPAIGAVRYGEPVTVTGAVTKDGADYGWYQIQLNGSIAYVSSSFLSATAPAAKSAETKQAEAAGKVQCEYCGEWFEAGNDYRNHVMAAHTGTGQDEELVQCEYCGEWFRAGNDYRNHVMAAHTGTGQNEELVQCEYCGEWFRAGNDYRNHVMAAHTSSGQDEDLVQCEYCGEWFRAGNDYRNHVMAAHTSSQNEDLVQCEYCGEWFEAGNDYRNHVMAAHSGQ